MFVCQFVCECVYACASIQYMFLVHKSALVAMWVSAYVVYHIQYARHTCTVYEIKHIHDKTHGNSLCADPVTGALFGVPDAAQASGVGTHLTGGVQGTAHGRQTSQRGWRAHQDHILREGEMEGRTRRRERERE